jgi:iron complex outermembrane recepter protein
MKFNFSSPLGHLANAFILFLRLSSDVYRGASSRLCSVCLIGLLVVSSAAAEGIIEGQIVNAGTQAHLSRARVSVADTSIQTLTDDSGFYRLIGVPSGKVELLVSYLGFAAGRASITLAPGARVRRDFELSRDSLVRAGSEGDPIVLAPFEVVAEQHLSAQAMALNEQRYAPNLKTVVALEAYGDRGTENIGEYLRFLPGVTILEGGGTPSSISLRGFNDSMTNITIDGAEIASSAGSSGGPDRTVTMSEVPMMNIERMEVTKVPTPDVPATGLGGSINLIRSNAIRRKPLFRYQVYQNFNSHDGLTFSGGPKRPLPDMNVSTKEPSGSVSYIHPVNRNLGISVGASRTWRSLPMEGPLNLAEWFLDHPSPYMRAFRWELPQVLTKTREGQVGVQWRVTPNGTLSFNAQRRESSSLRSANRIEFNLGTHLSASNTVGDSTFTQSAQPGNSTVTMGNVGNPEVKSNNNQLSLNYDHRGDIWRIDLGLTGSFAETRYGSRHRGIFGWVNSSITQLAIRGEGIGKSYGIIPATITAMNRQNQPVDVLDGANYSINSVRDDGYEYSTDRVMARINVARDFGHRLTLKTGVRLDTFENDTERNIPTWNFRPNGLATIEARRAGNFDVFDDTFRLDINGQRVRWISDRKVYQLYLQHPDWFVENTNSTLTNLANNSKLLQESILAGYIRADLRLLPSNALWIAAGVRYEHTTAKGRGLLDDPSRQYQRDAAGNIIRNAAGNPILITTNTTERARLRYIIRGARAEQDYGDLYPSFNSSYSFSENLVLRAAYARTLGRPNINNIVPSYNMPDPSASPDTDASRIRVNNPGLKPWTADSFDLSLETYLLKDGFGTIGVFQKNVSDFFGRSELIATEALLRQFNFPEESISGLLGDTLIMTENKGAATVKGLELSYRQSLTFLPDWARGFQVYGSYTHLRLSGSNASDFDNFTPTTASWGIDFLRNRFLIRLTCAYQTATRQAPTAANAANGIPEGAYRIQGAQRRYTLNAQYSLSRHLAIYGTFYDLDGGFTLNNTRWAPGVQDYARPYQYRKYGSNFTIGIKGAF